MIGGFEKITAKYPMQLDECEPDAFFTVWRESDGRIRMALHRTPLDTAKMIMADILRNEMESGNIANGWQLASKVTEK